MFGKLEEQATTSGTHKLDNSGEAGSHGPAATTVGSAFA